jgi:AmmeMemoRadiSam system protein A
MAAVLLPYWNDSTIVVASSDFTHYGAGFGYAPFRKDIPENLAKLDGGAVDRIEAIDPEGFESYVSKTGATICGRKPIALLLAMAREKGYTAKKLAYTTSGEMTGDYSTSVSYVSIAFLGGNGAGGDVEGSARSEAAPDKPLISGEEQATLLELARHTLRTWVETEKEPADLSAFTITDNLKRELGVFVTLKIKDRLRGCIGYLQGRGPLYKAVIRNTINAASNDPRFPPVEPDEEPGIRIEISVLSPVRKVESLDEIVVGRDGLIITRGQHRGTLLPQVAAEREWDRTKFLEETCFKAGLPRDAYKDPGTKIERYSAVVFGEAE